MPRRQFESGAANNTNVEECEVIFPSVGEVVDGEESLSREGSIV